MKYYVDESLNDFNFWGQADINAGMIKDYDIENGTSFWNIAVETADEIFNDDASLSKTDVNDWMAFDVPDDPTYAEIFE